MRRTDIAIAGGGLAGSTAAAMLGRAGIRALLIDPHEIYPPDFRCEKLDGTQVRILHRTGLTGAVLRAATADLEVWIARFGRLVEKRRNDQYDIFYDTLVNDYFDKERTILITTHQVEEVENLLTDVIFIQHGRIALSSSVEDLGTRYVQLAASSDQAGLARH